MQDKMIKMRGLMKIFSLVFLTSLVFFILKFSKSFQSINPTLQFNQHQAELTIINPHSYPAIGGNWTVAFKTIGTANLTIKAVDGTEIGKDIEFLEIRCGNSKTEFFGDVVFIENYSCNETSYGISKILTNGKHTLEFNFGNDVEYAYNQAEPPRYSLNSTNSTIAGTAVSHNLFWQDDVGLSHYLFSFDNCTGTLVNDTILKHYNLGFFQEKTGNIIGFNTTSPDYLNSQDGQYYNVTMDYVTKQQVNIYNWTSSDQEPNTRRFNTTATIYPVTYYINSTDTLQQQTGTTQREVLSLTWTPEAGSRYLVLGYLEANDTSTAEQILVRVFNNTHMLFYWADRPGVANTEILPFQFGIIQAGAGTPVKYNFTIASSSTGTAGAIRARLMAIRIDNLPNTHFNFSYNATEQADVNNVWGDAAGDTDTITLNVPTAGWYLIMGFAKLESDSTTGLVSYRLNIDNGAEYIPYGIGTASGNFNYSLVYDRNTAEEVSFGVVAVRYFTAGTHTISAQVADGDTTASADWQYRSLIALRLSDVFAWFNASSTTQATTTSTSFVNYTVLNIPANDAGNYLILGGITIQGSSTSYDHIHRLVVDGISYNSITERPYNANAYLARMLLQNVSFDANAHWVATQYRTSNSLATTRVKNSDIVAINLNGLKVPAYEQNTSWQTYNGFGGSDYQNVDLVRVILTIDSYNPSASNSTYNNNNRPDIEVGIWNGTQYINGFRCQINSSMGNNLLNTTDWNCTITTTDATIRNAWKLATNRRIQIRGIFLDAYNTNIFDEINVTNVYVYLNAWNVTGQDTFRLETEHNTTLSYTGSLINLTIFINFTSNVSTTYNLTIYNFATESWDYSKCSNGAVTANQFYYWNCTITENVFDYNNSANEVRVRLNQTLASLTQGMVSIDYITYQIVGEDYFPNFIPFGGGIEGWSNVTKIINETVGCQIRWCVYANDTSGNWNSSSCENPFTYFTTTANVPPNLGDKIESPPSPTVYQPSTTYEFSITINDPNGENDISTVIFEFDGKNETVTTYVVHNSTARNYSVAKTDLAAKPSGYVYKWYANDSQNTWGNVVEGTYIIQKATSSISISFSNNPVTYPAQITTICQKNSGDQPAILNLYRNFTQVAQGPGSFISEELILGAGVWNYSCTYQESENYTSSSISNQFLYVNKGTPTLNILINNLPKDLEVTYPKQTNATAYENNIGDDDVTYNFYRNTSDTSVFIASGSSISDILVLGVDTYYYVYNTSGGANWTSASLTRILTVNQNTSTLDFMHLVINGTEGNKVYVYPALTNVTAWFDAEAFVGEVPTFTLYRNFTVIGSSNPVSDVIELAAGSYNYTYYTPGNRNYSSAIKQFNLTINKADISPFLHLAINGTEEDAIYTYENVTNVTAWSTLTGQSEITYNFYRETSTSSLLIGSNNLISEVTMLGANTYRYIYNTSGNENYTSGSVVRILTINKKTPLNLLEVSPSWINTYPTETTVSCTIFSLNDEVIAKLYRNTSSSNPLPSTLEKTILGAGAHEYVCNSSATENYTASSSSNVLIINKAPTSIRLFLNGTEGNRTYNVSDLANFTVALNISGKIVHLETNISGWVLQSSITPLFNYTALKQKGVFNITGYFLGDENHTASSQTYFVDVVDVVSPSYSKLGQNSSWIGVGKPILLFAEWNDNYDLEYAWLSTNETGKWENKTVVRLNLMEGLTWSNFTWINSSIPAGSAISWRIYANDSSGNENATEIMNFFVNATEIWNYSTNGIIFSSPAVGDVNYDASIDVVFASYDKNVYAVSGKNGVRIWNFSTNGIISSSPSLASINNDNFLSIFIGSYDFNLYALNGSDGSKLWNFSTGGKIFSSPAIGDINKDGFLDVVFGSEDGKVYALNGSDGNLLWSFSTNGKIVSSPAIANLNGYPIVVIGSYDFNLYALNGSDGSKLWNFSTREKIESSPAVDDLDEDGKLEVVFGSYDRNVYVLDVSTGRKIWNYTTGNWITSSPVIAKINESKKIIISSHDGNVYCFNHDGSINWTFRIPTGGRVPYLPSVADLNFDGINDVVFGATDGRIYVVSGVDGKLIWSYMIGQYIYSSPAIADLNEDGSLDLTFGSTNKYQYALDPPSWSCFGGNERRTRILDNSPPQVLSFNFEERDGKKILTSLWRERFSNLDYAIVRENSTGSERIEKIKLKGMIDWVNYSFSNTSYYRVTVFDEYGNSETIEGFVEIGWKDSQAPHWFTKDDHIQINYSKSLEVNLTVKWLDENKIEKVLIEHNFSGEFRNESVDEIGNGIYSYLVRDLPAGAYVWREHAKDVYSNWNSTPFFILEIHKSLPLLEFYLPSKVVYPNPVTFECSVIEGDRNAKIILRRNGEERLGIGKIYGEETLKAGLWDYSCIHPETQNYSSVEITKRVEIERGFPVLSLLVNYERESCPAKINVTAYENNQGDEDVNYSLYENRLISSGSLIDYQSELKAGNYFFIYNSTGGENWTAGQISKMVVIRDSQPPQNLIFGRSLEKGKGLSIYSLWQENCSSLSYGIIEENSTGKFRKHEIKINGSLNWVNYTIPEKDLNSESGCKWFLFICFKDIHYSVRVFDEYKNQQQISSSFIYIFFRPQKLLEVR